MLGKKLGSFKNLAKMIKVKRNPDSEPLHNDHLLKMCAENGCYDAFPISTPKGYFVIYVGDKQQRFVVPTTYLSHPLFKMLLEKAYDDEEQKNRLVIPCNVVAFEKVLKTVECCNGMFDLGHFFEELI
ncbi:small auxin-up RNA [Artemisia annua]|uniref:Small auxin-up RNA n=1 Tax=Artemisia annua TaxID=35608 RepID=A0A2U1KS06_ARTAN|nr:small auxin-up RNA [Artemisia annua]PWA71379.1 small auxin-up RNA [Artemisia annua]